MIDFHNLIIRRLIIHTIEEKKEGKDCASAEYSHEMLQPEDLILRIIKQRLIDAAGKDSKAFELEIENYADGSFFSLVKNFPNHENETFVKFSQYIADLLAESQRKSNIPGGYLMVLDCMDEIENLPIHIVIKAEPHDGLQFQTKNGRSQVTLLEKVFLTPSQKLYKIGIIYAKRSNSLAETQQYGCFLFDDQFRITTHPAEYFYKDFLGFATGNNAKIQSLRFYQKTETFILNNFHDPAIKAGMLAELKSQFILNQDQTLNPRNFAYSYIPEKDGLRDAYFADVCSEIPSSFVKDPILLKSKLSKRNMAFPKEIKVVGPEENFDKQVRIVNTIEDLASHDFLAGDFTILKIAGRPYTKHEN